MQPYGDRFYEEIRREVTSSAEILVPILIEYFPSFDPDKERIIDVGCGEGWWANEFLKHGFEAWGIDGEYVSVESSPLRQKDRFYSADFSTGVIPVVGEFTTVICLEVAEHLPEQAASHFISELCRLGKRVIFSAAIPGQGGVGHINEQWPSYWVEKFNDHGFVVSDDLRFRIWNKTEIQPYYRQNLLIAWHKGNNSIAQEFINVVDVVHPDIYNQKLEKLRNLRAKR